MRMQTEGRDVPDPLTRHILPAAGTMIGVCTTLIGLVKIVEARTGPSHVDEYSALAALMFLVSAATSYFSMRRASGGHRVGDRGAGDRGAGGLERIADLCFIAGLVSLSLIAVLFAYETI